MHLHSTLLSSLLFAAAALAHPFEQNLFAPSLVERDAGTSLNAGAFLSRNTTFTSIGSFIVIPQLSDNSYANATAIAFWNGIGLSCAQNRFVVGVICFVNEDRSVSCTPASWYSEGIKTYDGLAVNLGDVIGLAVTLTDATTGTVYITNAIGGSIAQKLTSTQEICRSDIYWGLEIIGGDQSTNFQQFDSATFQWALATDVNGQSYVPSNNPSVSNVVLDGVALTSTYVEGASVIIDHS